MKSITQEQFDLRFNEIKELKLNNKTKQAQIKENELIKDLTYFININLYKQKVYSNNKHEEDLRQVALMAVLKSFKTYDASKGNFFGWASMYIQTDVSRARHALFVVNVPRQRKYNPKQAQKTLITNFDDLSETTSFEDNIIFEQSMHFVLNLLNKKELKKLKELPFSLFYQRFGEKIQKRIKCL